jgi:hypothetical protein
MEHIVLGVIGICMPMSLLGKTRLKGLGRDGVGHARGRRTESITRIILKCIKMVL